jgi:demethylmenaquinone methyltransferase / 2-methoxy-6-polyprenyl-1,4-benzoquinol methylase
MMPRPTESRRGNTVPEADVAAMFDEIAPVYDRVNTVMTAGGDGRWRRAAVRAAGVSAGDAVLDVACGTGKLSAALAERVGPFGRVVGVDLAPVMIEQASQAQGDLVQLTFQVANALDLPFPAAEFDAATIAFGLRNLADFEAGFRELARVVRPGGRVVCLELSTPPIRAWGRLYRATFSRLAPLAASAFGYGSTYRYLPGSLEGFPDAPTLAGVMVRAGLAEVTFRRLALGAVALHVGRVPANS